MSKPARHRARESFLTFFSVMGDHARAVEFVSAPGTFSAATIYLAVDSLLELGRREEADAVVRKARVSADDEEGLEFLREAADLLRTAFGDHEQAWALRRESTCKGPIVRNLVEGMVKSCRALAISDLDLRIAEFEKQQGAFDETALTLPGNQEGLVRGNGATCRKWQRRLGRLFTEEDRRSYRLNQRLVP